MKQHFDHVREWVFDLDNTLYAPTSGIFDQMDDLMTLWITRELKIGVAEAEALRHHYLAEYGTTLGGLIKHHGIDPDDFLEKTHALDLTVLAPDPLLREGIAALPGRKIVFTNGSRAHAERVVRARGLDGAFDVLYGIEDAGYVSKPDGRAFKTVFEEARLDPDAAAMFEDTLVNLHIPHRLGMRTVLVGDDAHDAHDHVHHATDDITDFVSRLIATAQV